MYCLNEIEEGGMIPTAYAEQGMREAFSSLLLLDNEKEGGEQWLCFFVSALRCPMGLLQSLG